MPCRVGITTNPEERKAYWNRNVHGLSNWRIIGTHKTKKAAQAQESNYAIKHGCHAHPGGEDVPGPWYVYKFDYTRKK